MRTADLFHDFVAALHALGKANRSLIVTTAQYDEIFTFIQDHLGEKERDAFVQICAIMQDGKTKTLARALIDLQEHYWNVDAVLGISDKKMQERTGYRSHYHYFNHYPRMESVPVPRYDEKAIKSINPERLEFLRAHNRMIYLTASQRHALRAHAAPTPS